VVTASEEVLFVNNIPNHNDDAFSNAGNNREVTGITVAGIVGVDKFAYDIWGSTVNMASRLEKNSEPNKINISHSLYQVVKTKYECTCRGKIVAKGLNEMEMYFVNGPWESFS